MQLGSGFIVNVAGSLAPVVRLSETVGPGITYETCGVDVASFAGKEVGLKFSSAPLSRMAPGGPRGASVAGCVRGPGAGRGLIFPGNPKKA